MRHHLKLLALIGALACMAWLGVGCHLAPKPVIVIHDPTPALLDPIDKATTQATHAQTQIVTALTLAQAYPRVVEKLQIIQADVNGIMDQLATAKVRILEFSKADIANQTEIQEQQARIAAEEARIKKLEADWWSVRQHRAALILKIMFGVFGVVSVVASIIVFTHPGVGALGWVAKSAVHIGMFIVTGSIHFWVWLVLKIRNHLHTPVAPKPATA